VKGPQAQNRSSGSANQRPSDLFEQRIHRIHELLEGSDAVVTWNDRVPDPDNPDQARQIDVTVKRGEHITLIECRIHRARQNVKWIEELIGRRTSLQAHSVVAVSASGFTRGAEQKAARHGVALRDLREWTDEQVLAWGQSIAITLICYQYSDLAFTLWIDDDSSFDPVAFKQEFPRDSACLTAINQAAKFLTDDALMMTEERVGHTVPFRVVIAPEQTVRIAGGNVRLLQVQGEAQAVAIPIACPRVEAYGSPSPEDPDAVIERFRLGETSVVHDGESLGILLDISALELPPLCQFRGLRTSGSDREVNIESFELIGWRKLTEVRGPIAVAVGLFADYVPPSQP
jgi:hypothetical protein